MSLTTYREICNELLNGLDELQDPRYPFPGYTTAAMDRARELLAQPALAEPPAEGAAWQAAEPADMAVEQLQHIIHREPWATWLRPGGCLESAHCELTDLLSSVIAADRARRAAPPADGDVGELATLRQQQAAPVPVSERPWENEPRWLDPDGECWWCPPDGPAYWSMVNPAMVYGGWLLPANAIPALSEYCHHG